MTSSNLHSKPLMHGKQYEETTRKKFEAETGLTVQHCGGCTSAIKNRI
jgi:hypothetical protein